MKWGLIVAVCITYALWLGLAVLSGKKWRENVLLCIVISMIISFGTLYLWKVSYWLGASFCLLCNGGLIVYALIEHNKSPS